MRTRWPVSLVAAVAAIAIYLILTLVAFLKYPGAYGPFTNWLSDLGNPQANPSGAVFYNLGCILASLALILFYVGLRQWKPGDRKMMVLLTIAQVAGVLSCFSLMLAAIFPLGIYTPTHSVLSKMVSVFLGFSLIFSTVSLLKHRALVKWLAYITLLTGFVNFLYESFLPFVFVVEWISVTMFMILIFLVACDSRLLSKSK
jgi:hypothetical membrane protein